MDSPHERPALDSVRCDTLYATGPSEAYFAPPPVVAPSFPVVPPASFVVVPPPSGAVVVPESCAPPPPLLLDDDEPDVSAEASVDPEPCADVWLPPHATRIRGAIAADLISPLAYAAFRIEPVQRGTRRRRGDCEGVPGGRPLRGR